MARRSIPLGLAAAIAAYLIAKIFSFALTFVLDDSHGGPFVNLLLEAIYSFPWLAGGFVAGYLSDKTPLKSGASTGAIYAAIYCLIGMSMLASQTHDLQERLSQLKLVVVAIIEYSFLFSLAAALGHTTKTTRKVL